VGRTTRKRLEQVRIRMRVSCYGARFYTFFLILAVAYTVLFLSSRLLALIPYTFDPVTLLIIPAGAAVLSAILQRRPSLTDAARLVDRQTDSSDLFLTSVLIARAAGEFKPFVLSQAEEKAASVNPGAVLPWRWGNRAGKVTLVCALLALLILFLPQYDPFGKEQRRQRVSQRKNLLDASRKATALRAAVLREKGTAEVSEEVARALDRLKKNLNALKPQNKAGNMEQLSLSQKELSDLWRKKSEERLEKALAGAQESQTLGSADQKKMEQWKKNLGEGECSAMKEELEELKKLTEKLGKETDPLQKQKMSDEIRKRLEDMANFSRNELG